MIFGCALWPPVIHYSGACHLLFAIHVCLEQNFLSNLTAGAERHEGKNK